MSSSRPESLGAAVDSDRPGFHLTCSFKGHANNVRGVSCIRRDRTFTSLDEKGVKQWRVGDGADGAPLLRDAPFPGFKGNYLTSLLYVEKLNVFIGACLEGTVHVYSDAMQLMVELELPRAARGAVVDMVYNNVTDELITAGESGVRAWYTVQNLTLWIQEHAGHPKPPAFRGATGPWIMGPYQDIRERMTLRVPGANSTSTNLSSSHTSFGKHLSNAEWVSRLVLHEGTQKLFCMMGVSVYGFNLEDGVRCFEWEAIHKQPITGVVYLPEKSQAITSSLEPSTVIWRVVPETGQVQQLRSFGQHAAGVMSMCLSPSGENLMTSAMDGMVVLWRMQSLEPVFQAKMPGPVGKLEFFSENEFMLLMGKEVRIMWLQWIQTIFGEYDSPVKSLEYLGKNLVLASFEDSAVRVIHARTAETLIVVAPQLSVSSHRQVLLNTWRSELYVLLNNGQLHWWTLQMGKIPQLKRILNPDMKQKFTCMAMLEGALLPPQAGMEVGLDVNDATGRVNDYLVVGTTDGDIQFLDLNNKGVLACRIPVTKVSGVSHVRVDPLRSRLITVCESLLQIWSLTRLHAPIREVKFQDKPNLMETALGQVYVGRRSGALQSFNIHDGSENRLPTAGDHSGRITGLEPNLMLDHFVSAGVDGKVKIFDWSKKLKVSLTLAAKLCAVCWLGDAGSVLAASGSRLLKIDASRCHDAYRKQGGLELFNWRRVDAARASEIYSMRGSCLLDPLLTGLTSPPSTPAGLRSHVSQRGGDLSTNASDLSHSIKAGTLRRAATPQTRAATPQEIPKYMMQGGANLRALARWHPVVNHMDVRLLTGMPHPPEPPDLPPPRTHQGLPGMGNFKAVPPSSPAGILKHIKPKEFRDGTPAEMWRRSNSTPGADMARFRQQQDNKYAELETTEDGKYVVLASWDTVNAAMDQHRQQVEAEDNDLGNNNNNSGSGGGAPRVGSGANSSAQRRSSAALQDAAGDSGPGGQLDWDAGSEVGGFGSGGGSDGLWDGGNEGDFSSEDEEDPQGGGGGGNPDWSDDSSGDDSEGFPEGLEGDMTTAYRFICKHYDLSEEVVKKLMLEEKMLRDLKENGTITVDLSNPTKKKKKKKKKKTSDAGAMVEASAWGFAQPAPKPEKKKKKKKKKKRRRIDKLRMLLGQEGIDALRARTIVGDILVGCHEYNACEVKTLAANQSFLPKVASAAKNHSKAPVGFRNRDHFPPAERPPRPSVT